MEGPSNSLSSSQSSSLPAVQTGQTDITKIPNAVLEHIFNFLDQYSAQEAAQVDKLWNVSVITAIKNEECNLLNNLFSVILEHIDKNKYPNEYEKINSIIEHNTLFDSISLLKIKNSLITTREALISQLIHLSKEDLLELQKAIQSSQSPSPRYFESMMDLAYLEKVAIEDEYGHNSDEDPADWINLAKSLYDKGQLEYDRLKRLNKNVSYRYRSHFNAVIRYASVDLINKGRYDQAALVSDLDTTGRSVDIIPELIKNNESDKAINLAKHVKNPREKAMLCYGITCLLTQKIDFDVCDLDICIKTINTLCGNEAAKRSSLYNLVTSLLYENRPLTTAKINAAEKIIKEYSLNMDKEKDLSNKSRFLYFIDYLRAGGSLH